MRVFNPLPSLFGGKRRRQEGVIYTHQTRLDVSARRFGQAGGAREQVRAVIGYGDFMKPDKGSRAIRGDFSSLGIDGSALKPLLLSTFGTASPLNAGSQLTVR